MRAVLLDLDGTLADSRPGIEASYRATAAQLGHTLDPAMDFSRVIGPPLRDAMTWLLAQWGDDRVEEAIGLYRAHYAAEGVFGAELFPGVPAMLDALRADGAALYVATAKRTEFARPMLARLEVADRLARIYGAEPGGEVDHKPELISHILRQEGLDPARCVMVGDRRYDVTGAHANGVRAVGVLWGYGTRAELEEAGADRLAERVADVPGAVRMVVD